LTAEYDYIVVGGGTAGCVLAARLSQDASARVLLLEAGDAERSRAVTVPNAWPENLGSATDWADTTIPQADAGPAAYPLGRVLGGSGAINAMAHVRGHRAVYDKWAAAGAPGWGFAELLPFFMRSECTEGRDQALRGTAGPVAVAPVPEAERHPLALAFAERLTEAGCPVTDDLSGRVQEGVAWVDLAIAAGQRVSSADAYLRPALGRENLAVQTGCLVTALTAERGRCAGVRYLRAGQTALARAAAEVVLCAGAVRSAQLLLLSGIGPAAGLRAAGVEPLIDLPGVGRNLQDHPIAMACYRLAEPMAGSGYNHGEVYAALRSGAAGDWPDLHLFPILLPLAPAGLAAPPAGFTLAAAVVAPGSRGSVRLASADPLARPLIDPALLREPGDEARLAEGLGLVRKAAPGLRSAGVVATEVWPGPDVRTSAEVRRYLRRTAGSYYHPAGSCRIGVDGDAVVDPQLRVHGVAGLRVADASVMPAIPNAHPNATVLAIAERAASLITGSPIN
jgi:choline dehydrogenase-like flavoprotein